MNGPKHYRKAEKLLEEALGQNRPVYNDLVAAAQVHATLALAAATAYPAVRAWIGDDEGRRDGLGWSEVTK